MERINELERAASSTEATHRQRFEQLQAALDDAQRKLTTAADAARQTAQTHQKAVETASQERDFETKRANATLDHLARLWMSSNEKQAEHQRAQVEHQQRTLVDQEQIRALQTSLAAAQATVREQRDQLDQTALALTKARASAPPAVVTTKLAQVEAALSAAQKELQISGSALVSTKQELAQALTAHLDTQKKRQHAETELNNWKKKTAELEKSLDERQKLAEELIAKTIDLSDRLRRAYEKKPRFF